MHIKKDSIYLLMHSGYFSWQHKYYYVDKGVLDFFYNRHYSSLGKFINIHFRITCQFLIPANR